MIKKYVLSAIAVIGATASQAASFTYADFSSTAGLQLNGSTQVAVSGGDSVLRLTDDLGQSGSAFNQTAITLAADVSFSTAFSFQMTDPIGIGDDRDGADGLVFVVQTVSNTAGGSGGGIGYQDLFNSVGVEFDTYYNGEFDINGNHVGINLEGDPLSVASIVYTPDFNDGSVYHAWVDYNGLTDLLEVRVSSAPERPLAALLGYTVDLAAVLGSTQAYVGFTSGTGAGGNDHDILSWQFNGEFNPIEVPPGELPTVPEPSTVIGGLALVGLMAARLRRK